MKNIALTVVMMLTVVLIGINAYGQGYSGIGANVGGFGGGAGQGSRFPIRVKLRGTLNPTVLKENSIKVAILSVYGYKEKYQFEIVQAEPVDDKQIPRMAIVPSIVGTDYDYLILGTKDLLSKIGQSVPNTPITIVGFLRQRKSELIAESIETISVHSLSSVESPTTEGYSPVPSSEATRTED